MRLMEAPALDSRTASANFVSLLLGLGVAGFGAAAAFRSAAVSGKGVGLIFLMSEATCLAAAWWPSTALCTASPRLRSMCHRSAT